VPAFTSASLAVLLSAAAFGQAVPSPLAPQPAEGLQFEVASIKPAVRTPRPAGVGGNRTGSGLGACPTALKMDRGRVDVKCATVAMLIGYAFRFSPDRVTGPDWMMSVGSPRFDIAATIPRGASPSQVPDMFQALLAGRFKLAIHRGTADRPMYALVVAKGGPKVKPAAPEPGDSVAVAAEAADPGSPPSLDSFYGAVADSTTPNADGKGFTTTLSNPRMGTVRETGDPHGVQRWEAPNISFAGLADLLDKVAPVSSPVIDMTGVKGRYRLVLEVSMTDVFAARADVAGAGVSGLMDMEDNIVRAFNDGLLKLGLHLERRKGPVEAIFVDHVEQTPTAN
jgi:uncharacterized protein (TIGR03435 family)